MNTETLRTSTEHLDKNKVKVRVEVPEATLNRAIDAAYRRWSKEIKVPGFRKGKIPRQIIDTRVGADVVREEALREALPDLYVEALRSEELEAIAPPEIDVVTFESGEPLVFEATVDVRPEITPPDPATIEVEAPPDEVTDADVDEQLEKLRERFAELETVSREARRGDYVLIDLKGYHGDQPVEGAGAPDLLYEVGSRTGPPKLDSELEGERAGAILKFNDVIGPAAEGAEVAQEVSFTVLLKEVKAKKLPPLDDEFAKTVGEFDELGALKQDLRERLAELKSQMVEEQVRNLVLEAFVDASDLEAPERLVQDEFDHRIAHIEEDLKGANMTLGEYLARSNETELEFRRDVRAGVAKSVKAELLLEQLARDNDIQISDEDLGREIAYLAARTDSDPQELAQQLASSGRLRGVAADIMRRKALDHVVEHATIRGRAAGEQPGRDEEQE